jgi:uncharacterized caspase-like protein
MQLRLISSVLAVVMGLLISAQGVRAQNHLALVIGINDYQNVFSLQKAVGDAKAIQESLQSLGFQVSTLFNGTRRSFNAAVSALAARIQPGDVVLVHYSGHGVQLDGENFLLPVDVPSPSAVDKEFLKSEAIALSVMIDRIKAAGARTAVFIIDACRNNPYATATTRGVGGTRGLAAVAPPKGTFVMYSAGQGQSALDRLSDDDREPTSVYTRTLRAKMLVEGLAITDLARAVRDEVEAAAGRVNHEQRPAYYDELSGSPFYFVPPKAQAATVTQPTAQLCGPAADHWRSAEAIGTIAAFEDHLARFPNCAFAGLAKARLESTKQKSLVISPQPVSRSDRNYEDGRQTALTPKPAETLVPETIPFIPNRDRNSVRADYLPAPDHKALAISVSVVGFMTGQKDVDSAKRGALENCQRAQSALNPANKCELYAVGDVIVFTRGIPPMPPEPWINRESSIERPFVVNDIPLISDSSRGWLEKNYPTRGKPKALAIGGANFGMAAIGQSVEEVVRRALEICGGFAGIPCMIAAIDDVFVVPIPTKMKPVGVFRADSNSAIIPQKRDYVALRLRKAKSGWNAVAVGASGRPGLILNARNEPDAIDGALADCRRQDRDCRVIGLGPFEVAPK